MDFGSSQEVLQQNQSNHKFEQVEIMASKEIHLNFKQRNYKYINTDLGTLFERIEQLENPTAITVSNSQNQNSLKEYEHMYYRSLSFTNRNKERADFFKDYSKLKNDFKVPSFMKELEVFSTVFRISTKNTGLWLHYDIMDNFLFSVYGEKEILLFDSSEIDKLYFNKSTSELPSLLSVDSEEINSKYELVNMAKPYKCILKAGEVLYIPALWPHEVKTKDTYTLSLNMFYYHMDKTLFSSSDIYGNHDLVPFTQMTQNIEQLLEKIKDEKTREFNVKKLIHFIKSKYLAKNKH